MPSDGADGPVGPPPGWYPVPGLQLLRWWDGKRWGSQTQPVPGYQQASQPQYPGASGGYDAFRQQSAGQYPQQSGPQSDTAYPPGVAFSAYPASFPPAQPQQPDPHQPREPQDPYQQAGWPQQQAYVPGPQPQPRRAPRRPKKRKARSALIGLSALIGIIVAIIVATGHSSSSSGNTAASSAAPSSSTSAAPSCASQVAAWVSGGGVSDLQAVGTDMGKLGQADTALSDAISAGEDVSQQEAALQTAAASVQADAQTANADLPPSCIPHFRTDLRAALTDADKAGIDSAETISEMSSGDYSVATADMQASDNAENAGNAKLTAALADIKAYENANG